MKISNRLMDRLIQDLPITSPKKSNGWEHVKNITIITTAEKMHLLRCFCNMARSVLENCFVAKEVVMTPLPLKLPGYLRGRSLSTIGPSYFIKE